MPGFIIEFTLKSWSYSILKAFITILFALCMKSSENITLSIKVMLQHSEVCVFDLVAKSSLLGVCFMDKERLCTAEATQEQDMIPASQLLALEARRVY